ncbi:O-antigen ligase [Georgenia soli]|uniref:O-antigen ligase n=1 Tax=Georgenia soli TaxID=638953 RepID=A0A2A9EKR7_9MICO|nr:O-antigen ligase family protein [Georgenia soli]PFG38852.1 O-antigen ligase [Georgenia soli]
MGALAPTLPGRRPPGPWAAVLALPLVAFVIPSSLVIAGPLHSNGWPGRLLVFWIAGAFALGWIVRQRPRRTSPAEVGCWLLLLGLTFSLAAAGLRTLSDVEAAGVLRYALVLFPLVVLAIGVASSASPRLCDALLLGIFVGAVFSSFIAVAQFVVPFSWEELLQLPGLDARGNHDELTRGDFFRVQGTTVHPIEFGVIAGAAVPLGLHLARYVPSRLGRQLATLSTLGVIGSIPLSISRSGVLVLMLAVAAYAVVLSPRQRATALVLGMAGLLLFRAAIPGLLGTVLGAFTDAETDTSISSRTDGIAAVTGMIEKQPILGYGLGTFRPEEYIFLDNQYLMSLVEGGLVLVAGILAWVFLALASARGAARRGDAVAASRAQAVFAGILAIAASGAFFDLFSFAQVTVMLFLLVGVAGALWHDGVATGRPLPSPIARFRAGAAGLGKPVVAAGVATPAAVTPGAAGAAGEVSALGAGRTT